MQSYLACKTFGMLISSSSVEKSLAVGKYTGSGGAFFSPLGGGKPKLLSLLLGVGDGGFDEADSESLEEGDDGSGGFSSEFVFVGVDYGFGGAGYEFDVADV